MNRRPQVCSIWEEESRNSSARHAAIHSCQCRGEWSGRLSRSRWRCRPVWGTRTYWSLVWIAFPFIRTDSFTASFYWGIPRSSDASKLMHFPLARQTRPDRNGAQHQLFEYTNQLSTSDCQHWLSQSELAVVAVLLEFSYIAKIPALHGFSHRENSSPWHIEEEGSH